MNENFRCEACQEILEEQYFDSYQEKCILHSDKSISSNNIENFCSLLEKFIKQQHKKSNTIILKDIYFPSYGGASEETNYEKILNIFEKIVFRNCTFRDQMELNNNMELRFDKCIFHDEWNHIFCKKIVYSKCIFEKYTIYNIAESKKIVDDHMLYNCQFQHIDCEGVIFKKKFFKFDNNHKAKRIKSMKFIRCEFEEDFILTKFDEENSIEDNWIIGNINFEHSIFHKKVKLQFCDIRGKANFYNTTFKDLADFYRTIFNQVIFEG